MLIAKAVEQLHSFGFAHCNLGSRSVYLTSEGFPLLGDFHKACTLNDKKAMDFDHQGYNKD